MTLRVGLLGAGYFAGFHREAWGRVDGARLVAAADADPAKGADHASLGAMLTTCDLDVVDIATPPATHATAIRTALEHRPKLILCQKPFCKSLEEAERIAAEAAQAGIPLVIHENFRFQPWFRAMRTALDAGRVGRVLGFTFHLRPGDGQGPDAYLARQPYFRTMRRFLIHETGVHYLDVARFLLGDPGGVYADLRRLNPAIRGEDAGLVVLDYPDGARAVLDGNRCAPAAGRDPRLCFGEAWMEGEDATLRLTGDGALRLRGRDGAEEELLAPRDWAGFAGDSVHALQAAAVATLRGDGAFENAAGAYLTTLRLVETVYAAAGARARVPFESNARHSAVSR